MGTSGGGVKEADKGRLSSVPVLSIDYDHNFLREHNNFQKFNSNGLDTAICKVLLSSVPRIRTEPPPGTGVLSVCLPLAAAQDEEGGRSQIKMQL